MGTIADYTIIIIRNPTRLGQIAGPQAGLRGQVGFQMVLGGLGFRVLGA